MQALASAHLPTADEYSKSCSTGKLNLPLASIAAIGDLPYDPLANECVSTVVVGK